MPTTSPRQGQHPSSRRESLRLIRAERAGKTTLIRIINRITAPTAALSVLTDVNFTPEDIYQIGLPAGRTRPV